MYNLRELLFIETSMDLTGIIILTIILFFSIKIILIKYLVNLNIKGDNKMDLKKIIRGVLALGVIGTVCYLAITGVIAIATFTTMATMVLMFYFKKDED